MWIDLSSFCSKRFTWSLNSVLYYTQLQLSHWISTITIHLLSGHLRFLTYTEGTKSYAICTECSTESASPEHILMYLGLSRQNLTGNFLSVLDCLKVFNVMDLMWILLVSGDMQQQQYNLNGKESKASNEISYFVYCVIYTIPF